jgi:hypothetical protein
VTVFPNASRTLITGAVEKGDPAVGFDDGGFVRYKEEGDPA